MSRANRRVNLALASKNPQIVLCTIVPCLDRTHSALASLRRLKHLQQLYAVLGRRNSMLCLAW